MNIAYFNYEWDPAASLGAATHMSQMTAALERMGHRVRVFDRHRKPASNRNRNGKPSPWLWEPATYLRSWRDITREIEILRQERPDVVLARHALRFSIIAAAHRLGLPVVLEVNAPIPCEIRRYRPGLHLLPGVSEWVERSMLLAADGVFVVSSLLRDHFVRRGVDPGRIAVIPNGADVSSFHPRTADAAIRDRLPGRILVGFAGSFARFHGLELLEYAIRRTAAHFVLLGDGAGARELERRCRREGCDGRVSFLGAIPHNRVPSVLAAMDVLVAPYPQQDFFYFSPIKVFEYMACGKALVAARQGQIAEVIEHGHNGLLYDPSSADDFVEKIAELLHNPSLRQRLGERARETVEQNYTWEHNATRVTEILERAAQNVQARRLLTADN